MDDDQALASHQADAARARRRAAISEAFVAVTQGPRIPITETISVPLRLLGTVQQVRAELPPSGGA